MTADQWDPDLVERQLVCDPDDGNNVEVLASDLYDGQNFEAALAAHLPCDGRHDVVTFHGAYRP